MQLSSEDGSTTGCVLFMPSLLAEWPLNGVSRRRVMESNVWQSGRTVFDGACVSEKRLNRACQIARFRSAPAESRGITRQQ